MKRLIGVAALALSACVVSGEDAARTPDPLLPLAQSLEQPRLAMLEHVLAGYFASDIPNPPTVCASWHDGREEEALPPEDELALMARFPQLAPMARCSRTDNGWRDTETDEPALVFTLHNFSCASEQSCSAWGGYRSDGANSMSYLYQGEWNGTEWHFTRDPRIIAE
ncbi:hypothetical protein [Aurantiacibacter poecillastricola]|uniref:hypothetical protein n=1 Tax=Aurantiacibacter poecillastricola TaxID=3064385 RepID=UPI00273FF15B|nr:hypothetical protein [Aurantiacibacter sp. 219JJ12-13]MDP5261816.1 hypothetical protein [Aurantiacibacter sp. 219JJ12-13]